MTWALNRGVEGVEIAKRALAMLPADETDVRPRVLAWLARASFLRGKLRESVADGEAALELAVAVHDPVAEAELLNTLGMARAALETAQEGLRATPRYHVRAHDWSAVVVSQMAFEAGDWGLAARSLSPSPSSKAGTLFLYRQLCEVYQALGRGDDETAQRCLEAVGELARASAEPQWIGAHGAVLAEFRARPADLDGAQAARPYPAAVARWREAEALVAAGERDRAAEVFSVARAMATGLGSAWLGRELRRLGDRARLRVPEAGVAAVARAGGAAARAGGAAASAGSADDPFGLTPRERQVLELLAGGATNRQIGAALYMAEKTASVHVSRILAKLGARGRTEAAALAHRRHLV